MSISELEPGKLFRAVWESDEVRDQLQGYVRETIADTEGMLVIDEVGGTLGVIDENEQIEDFREIPPEALLTMALNLEQVTAHYSKKIDGNWRDWGYFRAIIHRLV